MIRVVLRPSGDPFVFLDGEDVTGRCFEVTLLPGRRARVGLFLPGPDGEIYFRRASVNKDGDLLHLFPFDAYVERSYVEGSCRVEAAC